MARTRRWFAFLALIATSAACGGQVASEDEDTETRDLTLPAAEPIGTIADEPEPDPEPVPEPLLTEQARPRSPAPEPEPEPEPEPDPEPEPEPIVPTLMAGTVFTVEAQDTLTSRHNEIGDAVSARVREGVRDENGMLVLPPGAVLLGTITDIAPAESPGGEGRMVLTFDGVELDGWVYQMEARLDSLGTRRKGRGVTAGDAAKVGAGAVVGAIAGRVLGGNRTGTVVGAAAGAAAGVGIAAATRDVDIILDAGAPIRLVLTAPLVLR